MNEKCQKCPGRCTESTAPIEPIADLVPMPDNAMSELEIVTKNALAVGMMSTTDRRALAAMGYFAAETALLKPMIALGINNIHRSVHELIRSGMDPMALWQAILAMKPADDDRPGGPVGPCCDKPEEDDSVGFITKPDGYEAWITLPQTIKAEDITILEPAPHSKVNDLSVTLTRAPLPGEEDLAEGLDVGFPDDALVSGVLVRLNGNVLHLFVPRPPRTRHSVVAVQPNPASK